MVTDFYLLARARLSGVERRPKGRANSAGGNRERVPGEAARRKRRSTIEVHPNFSEAPHT